MKMRSLFTKLRATFFAAASIASLNSAGCSVVDQYGPRAIAYNTEAFDTRSELILTNIMRAAYRQPLQFSEVSSVTGIASAGGTFGATVPVIGVGSSLAPQITASGGPNFSFSNLSTQEFYQASSAEIDNATISLMLNQGFDPRLIFQLAISDITIAEKNTIRRVRMDFDTPLQFNSASNTTTGLLTQGLTAKSVGSDTQIGPELSSEEAKAAAFSILRSPDVSKSPGLSKNAHGRYEISRGGSKIILCFDPTLFEQNNRLDQPANNRVIVELNKRRKVWLALKGAQRDPNFTIDLPESYRCGAEKAASKTTKPVDNNDVKLVFRMRSLQGIYEYLGSIVRMQLGLNGVQDNLSLSTGGPDLYLFKIRRDSYPGGIVRANTEFGSFSIAADPTGYDMSMQALKAIAFLQALNSKATTLPAPVTTSVLVR